jgi:hypothetical protein
MMVDLSSIIAEFDVSAMQVRPGQGMPIPIQQPNAALL